MKFRNVHRDNPRLRLSTVLKIESLERRIAALIAADEKAYADVRGMATFSARRGKGRQVAPAPAPAPTGTDPTAAPADGAPEDMDAIRASIRADAIAAGIAVETAPG